MDCDFCGNYGNHIYCVNCENKFHRDCYYSCDSCPICNYSMEETFDTSEELICV